jgi:cytochrome P450/NADPH-cytochrome P450 reductase
LEHHLELNKYATKEEIRNLADHMTEADESLANVILNLASDENYTKKVAASRMTLADIITEYSIRVEISLLDLWPRSYPRHYSISSSPLLSPTLLSITVGRLTEPYESQGASKVYLGTCSSALSRLEKKGERSCVIVDTNIDFRVQNPEKPVIFVAVGTGISPFRAFLQDRKHWKNQGKVIGKCVMFYGCKNKAQELYKSEWDEYQNTNILDQYFVAFSRQENFQKKICSKYYG